jgi:tetratricopeptide (TPR) repeat protein
MVELKRLPDEQLARQGRHLVKSGYYALASEFLSEYCSRLIAKDLPIGSGVMAAYGLAVGASGDVQEGIEMCQRALAADRRNPDIWAVIARLSLLSGSRQKAVEAITRGLALAPRHRELLDLRRALGERRPPPVSFLPREHPINFHLGRLLYRLRAGSRTRATSPLPD